MSGSPRKSQFLNLNPDRPFDYFDELLRRIQDIRTAEPRFYQKITERQGGSIMCPAMVGFGIRPGGFA